MKIEVRNVGYNAMRRHERSGDNVISMTSSEQDGDTGIPILFKVTHY